MSIPAVAAVSRIVFSPGFGDSASYWERRYARGGTSGPGSGGPLADFKATVLNRFVREHDIQSVIEFGSGDGGQLLLAEYPRYIGLDVSPSAVSRCATQFGTDRTKSFFLYDGTSFHDPLRVMHADLALSLDVIYHLIEDEVFERYLRHLFGAADRFVIIFASDQDELDAAPHVRHRHWTPWVAQHAPNWRLIAQVPNPNPYARDLHEGSFADFFVFEKHTP